MDQAPEDGQPKNPMEEHVVTIDDEVEEEQRPQSTRKKMKLAHQTPFDENTESENSSPNFEETEVF